MVLFGDPTCDRLLSNQLVISITKPSTDSMLKKKALVHSFFDVDATGKYRPKCGGMPEDEDGKNPLGTARLESYLLFTNRSFETKDPIGFRDLVLDIHGRKW